MDAFKLQAPAAGLGRAMPWSASIDKWLQQCNDGIPEHDSGHLSLRFAAPEIAPWRPRFRV